MSQTTISFISDTKIIILPKNLPVF